MEDAGFLEGYFRLSDRILFALELAVAQGDVAVADELVKALELSMTRKTGGDEFEERREYPPEVEEVLANLEKLRTEKNEEDSE